MSLYRIASFNDCLKIIAKKNAEIAKRSEEFIADMADYRRQKRSAFHFFKSSAPIRVSVDSPFHLVLLVHFGGCCADVH